MQIYIWRNTNICCYLVNVLVLVVLVLLRVVVALVKLVALVALVTVVVVVIVVVLAFVAMAGATAGAPAVKGHNAQRDVAHTGIQPEVMIGQHLSQLQLQWP